jgi:CHAT domain-containing protein
MKPDEMIIDFIHFERFKYGEWTDTIWYYAILIDPKKKVPDIIKITDESTIIRLLDQGLNHHNMDSQLKTLSEIILNPLLPYLKGKKKISVSPSGALYRVPFSGLVANRKFLVQNFELDILAHLRSFRANEEERPSGPSALLIGGLDFGPSRQINASFPPLPGSTMEIKQIGSKLNSKGWITHELVGDQATRTKTMSAMAGSSAQILHLATHGFSYNYIQNDDVGDLTLRNRIVTSTNPLLRCGLALSQINDYWSAPNQVIEDETGILTAFDIANMQLPHTKLVFLSACESGVGDIHSKEGVFGLPRSFQLAGADQVIYTLWSIDDQITNKFVQYFYKHYLRINNTKKAFRRAQIKMSRKYNPYFWSGFILLN